MYFELAVLLRWTVVAFLTAACGSSLSLAFGVVAMFDYSRRGGFGDGRLWAVSGRRVVEVVSWIPSGVQLWMLLVESGWGW